MTAKTEKQIMHKDSKGTVSVPSETSESEIVTKQEIEVKRLAGEIVSGLVEVGNKYLKLCSFIRDNQVTKQNATRWLIDMGFSKPRASEVCSVSALPAEQWSEFSARKLGWRGALQLSRGNLDEMKKVSPAIVPPEIVKEVTAELVKAEEAGQSADKYAGMDDERRAEAVAKDKKAAWAAAMETSAVRILKYAELRGMTKGKKWSVANGFELELKRVKTVPIGGAKPGSPAGKENN